MTAADVLDELEVQLSLWYADAAVRARFGDDLWSYLDHSAAEVTP